MATRTIPEQHVPKKVSDAILRMIKAMHAEYGYDFSYEVLARGHIIAAANKEHQIDPRVAHIGRTTYHAT